MNDDFLRLEYGDIFYKKWGAGARILIALHGYGADHRMFEAFGDALGNWFKIYAIDLPFHGQSVWRSNAYQLKDIASIIDAILKKENSNRCSMLAHSFGARLALKLLKCRSDRIEGLYLLSPDGIRTYWLGLARFFPKWLRIWSIKSFKNSSLLRLSTQLRRWGILPLYVERFLQKNLDSPEHRARLLGTWLSLNAFILNYREIKYWVKKYRIKVIIMAGNRDKLLNVKTLQKFANNLPNAAFHLLEGGHIPNAQEVVDVLQSSLTT